METSVLGPQETEFGGHPRAGLFPRASGPELDCNPVPRFWLHKAPSRARWGQPQLLPHGTEISHMDAAANCEV